MAEDEVGTGAPADPVVIVGAGHAGVAVAAALRARGWSGGVALVEAQPGLPYERPPLSKEALAAAVPGASRQIAVLRRPDFYQAKDIRRIEGGVRGVDRFGHTVALDDGRTLHYHRLVIATGARARELSVPGHDLPGVLALRTAADADRLHAALVPGAQVVVIGAGYIGMEVAAAAAKRGCTVTVLEYQDRVMKRVTSAPVSRFFEDLHRARGVRFAFGAAVEALAGNGRVERVITSDGSAYAADVVVVGIGVLPDQGLAADAGIACRDGILVDETGRTSDPAVYAAGDVTRFISPFTGTELRLECLQNAQHQAEVVADALTGRPRRKPEVPWFWTIQHDVRLQTAGVRHPEDDLVVRGDPASGRFSVAYLRDGRLTALDSVGGLTDFRQAKKLIAQGAVLAPVALADPARRLDDCVVEVEHRIVGAGDRVGSVAPLAGSASA